MREANEGGNGQGEVVMGWRWWGVDREVERWWVGGGSELEVEGEGKEGEEASNEREGRQGNG